VSVRTTVLHSRGPPHSRSHLCVSRCCVVLCCAVLFVLSVSVSVASVCAWLAPAERVEQDVLSIAALC
jgi:hypothetical protein